MYILKNLFAKFESYFMQGFIFKHVNSSKNIENCVEGKVNPIKSNICI